MITVQHFGNGHICLEILERLKLYGHILPSGVPMNTGKFSFFNIDTERQSVSVSDEPRTRPAISVAEFFDMHPLPVKKDEKWNGEGLPPVGTVCEVFNHDLDASEWEECTIKYMGPFVVVYESKSCTDRSANHSRNVVNFRPIRTKRDKWIDKAAIEAHKEGLVTTSAAREIAGRIYDAGLAKDDEE